MCGSGGGNGPGGRGSNKETFDTANVSTSNIIGGRGSTTTEKVGEAKAETAGNSFARSALSRIGGLTASAIGGPALGFAVSQGISAMTEGAVGVEADPADKGRTGESVSKANNVRRAAAASEEDKTTDLTSTATTSTASAPTSTTIDNDSKARTQTILAGGGIARNKLKTRLGS